MKHVLVIGIGAGDPDYLTLQAVKAMNRVDVFFVIDKGPAKDDLARLRRELCERHITDASACRFVSVDDPVRDRRAAQYGAAVDTWREQRIDLYEELIARELGPDDTGGFLIWGDPSLYDGTMTMLDAIAARGRVTFGYEVIPGISSVSALAARHHVPLNRVAESIQITTGRRLAATGVPDGVDNVVVMLDGENAFTQVSGSDLEIFWGAFSGTEDEILMAGPVDEVAADIVRVREEARARKGWMFDTYLLRRRSP